MVKKYIQLISSLIIAGVLVSCTASEPIIIREPVEVLVPVPVNPVFPSTLTSQYVPKKLPSFISPTDPTAVVGLSEDDLLQLRVLIRDLVTRDAAWQAFAKEYSQ